MTLRSSLTTWRLYSRDRARDSRASRPCHDRPAAAGRAAGSYFQLVCVTVVVTSSSSVRSPQGRRDSNPQPPVLETGTLPIELLPFGSSYCRTTQCTSGHARGRTAGAPERRPLTGWTRRSAGTRRWSHGPRHASPPDRRHRRVRHPRRRRQGQGAEGRRARRDRLRRGRARLPDARARSSSGRDRGLPATPRCTTTRPTPGLPALRQAIADKTRRDSGVRGHGRPGAGHQRRQAGGLRGVRHAARPGRRGAAAGAVLDDLPGVDPAGRRRAGRRRRPTAASGYLATVEQLEAARTAADQGAAVLLAVEPDRRGLPAARRSRRSAAGRSSTASG